MLRLLLEQRQQNIFGFLLFLQNHVEAGQIEIGLVKVRGNAYACLESLFRVRVAPFPNKEDA